MLARLHRALVLAPPRFARRLTTSPSCARPIEPGSSSHEGFLHDSAIIPSTPPTPAPVASTSQLPTTPPTPRLSYLDLPDHKIFLDIPPAEDPLIRYLTSLLQHDGKRHTAERRAKRMLLHLHTLTRAAPLEIFRDAVRRVSPDVRIVRHRHATKDVPIPVALKEKQQVRNALKWMLKASESRGGRTVEERLAREVVRVMDGSSDALKQKDVLHKMAMVNRGNIPTR